MIKNSFFLVAGFAATLYLVMLIAAVLFQRSLLYVPNGRLIAPADVGLAAVVERRLQTSDGATLIAWFTPPKPGRPTILYFHGNAGHLADRAPRIARFAAEGYGVYMLAYRSFAGSTGSPSEVNNRADAVLAYIDLLAAGVSARSIVAYGESLGTNLATLVAIERPVAGLILDAPYTSVADVAAQKFWFFPVRALLYDHYDTAAIIDRLRVPLLVIHGTRDEVIPVAMGRAIAARAPDPKRLAEFAEGHHTDLYINGNDAMASVRTFVNGLPAGR